MQFSSSLQFITFLNKFTHYGIHYKIQKVQISHSIGITLATVTIKFIISTYMFIMKKQYKITRLTDKFLHTIQHIWFLKIYNSSVYAPIRVLHNRSFVPRKFYFKDPWHESPQVHGPQWMADGQKFHAVCKDVVGCIFGLSWQFFSSWTMWKHYMQNLKKAIGIKQTWGPNFFWTGV